MALTADLGVVTYTGFAPQVIPTEIILAADIGNVTYTGFAPTLSLGSGISLTAGLGAVTYTGFVPVMTSIGTLQDTMVFSEQMRLRDGYLAVSLRDRVRGARGDE